MTAVRPYGVALVLGALTGLVASGFLALVALLVHLVWDVALGGSTHPLAVLATCTVGGVLVGLVNVVRREAEPASEVHDLDTALEEDDEPATPVGLTRGAVLGVVSLGFGASLGPEAPLIVLVAGLAGRISRALHLARDEAVQLSMTAAVGGLFGGPLGAVALPVEGSRDLRTRVRRLGPALVAALAGLWVLLAVFPGGYLEPFDVTEDAVPDARAALDLLLWPLLAAVLATVGGLALHRLLPLTEAWSRRLTPNRVLRGAVGGLVLGACGAITPLVLFSGHHEIQELLDETATLGAAALLGIAALKLVATVGVLATGWAGGEIFPAAMIGSALGLAVAAVSSTDAVGGCLAAGLIAASAATMRKPVAALLVLLVFLPTGTFVAGALGAAVAAAALRATHDEPHADTDAEPAPA